MDEINKRTVSKFAAKLAVSYAVGSLIVKTLAATIPATRNYKIAEITGAVGGYVASNKLQPYTDAAIDDLYDALEDHAKKKSKKN